MDWQAKEQQAKTAAFNIWNWSNAHRYVAGMLIGAVVDRIVKAFLF